MSGPSPTLRLLNTVSVSLALCLLALAGWHMQNPEHFELFSVRDTAPPTCVTSQAHPCPPLLAAWAPQPPLEHPARTPVVPMQCAHRGGRLRRREGVLQVEEPSLERGARGREWGEWERGSERTPVLRCHDEDGLGGVPSQLKCGQGGFVPVRSSKDGAVVLQHADSSSEPKGGGGGAFLLSNQLE
jgi:hypothetical protein